MRVSIFFINFAQIQLKTKDPSIDSFCYWFFVLVHLAASVVSAIIYFSWISVIVLLTIKIAAVRIMHTLYDQLGGAFSKYY